MNIEDQKDLDLIAKLWRAILFELLGVVYLVFKGYQAETAYRSAAQALRERENHKPKKRE